MKERTVIAINGTAMVIGTAIFFGGVISLLLYGRGIAIAMFGGGLILGGWYGFLTHVVGGLFQYE